MQYNPDERLRHELFAILVVNTAVGALLLIGEVMLAAMVAAAGAIKLCVFLRDWSKMCNGAASAPVAAVGCDD